MERHSDPVIRAALRRKKLRHHEADDDVLIIDELGLAHARSRIDLAVLNGCLHGYEIKSERDTLDRLTRQLDVYRQTLGRLTYVCSTRHIEHTIDQVPVWCGIMEAARGKRGAVNFKTLRRSALNPELDTRMLAHLLWHSEAANLLAAHGASKKDLRQPRAALYEMIASKFSTKEVTAAIKAAMRSREGWRDHPSQQSCGG